MLTSWIDNCRLGGEAPFRRGGGRRAGRQRMTALEVLRYSLRAAGSCGRAEKGCLRASGPEPPPAPPSSSHFLGFPDALRRGLSRAAGAHALRRLSGMETTFRSVRFARRSRT